MHRSGKMKVIVISPSERSPDMELKEVVMQLSDAYGVSGHEANSAELVKSLFSGFVDEVRVDRMGSVIMLKRGRKPGTAKVMLAAHYDEIGMIVKRIEKGGFIRVTQVGGIDQRILPSMEVTVHGRKDILGVFSACPPHLQTEDDRKKAWKMEDLVIDCGYSEEELRKLVRVGDIVSFRRKSIELQNGRIAGKSMDDRVCLAAIWQCASELSTMQHDADVYFVATVQEEITYGGGYTATFGIMPDIGIAVDVGFATMPGVSEDEGSALGAGANAEIAPDVNPKVLALIRKTAKDRGIGLQLGVSGKPGGTDAFPMQVTGAGVATAILGLPVRNMHTSVETLDIEDVKNCGRLMAHFCAAVDSKFKEGLTCCLKG